MTATKSVTRTKKRRPIWAFMDDPSGDVGGRPAREKRAWQGDKERAYRI
jgi:hypothetical protein